MKTTTLIALIVAFASPMAESTLLATTSEKPIVNEQTAIQTATNELRRRGLVLPVGYEAEVAMTSYKPEIGSATPLFAVTFFAGRAGHRIRMYLVTIDRRDGEVDFVSNSLTAVEATLPSSSLSSMALRTAASEIRRRRLPFPAGYRVQFAQSVVSFKSGPDKKVIFVTFMKGQAKQAKRLYQVAVNRSTSDVEFVFDFLARTMD